MAVNAPTYVSVFESQLGSDDLLRLTELLEQAHPKLVGMDGEEICLPESLYQVLRQVTPLLAQGKGVTLIPQEHHLTTQEAANVLNISRPHLYKLLDQGKIPFVKVGSHRRIKAEDILSYRQKQEGDRQTALTELITASQELGFYQTEAV
ncbi:MAG: helix-turn-helix domain-containing protein [Limnothrix sp. RL_2_0]|nr:helix-turn-helix domain-containing protein [Limnothrix sp. RL_2_0]